MMICIGGVCVPLNLLIPFLVGILHRYGWFKWFRQEWVTLRWWKLQFSRWTAFDQREEGAQAGGTGVTAAEQDAKDDEVAVSRAAKEDVTPVSDEGEVRKRGTSARFSQPGKDPEPAPS